MKDTTTQIETIYPAEYEKASNAYLMAVVSLIAGLPLPIINVIVSFFYYISQRKTAYFVRWHCIQAIISQAVILPFNSVALWWTIKILFSHITLQEGLEGLPHHYYTNSAFAKDMFTFPSAPYCAYIAFVLFLNCIEFIAVISTAIAVRKGKNARWFVIANITDALVSKENRDPYKI